MEIEKGKDSTADDQDDGINRLPFRLDSYIIEG